MAMTLKVVTYSNGVKAFAEVQFPDGDKMIVAITSAKLFEESDEVRDAFHNLAQVCLRAAILKSDPKAEIGEFRDDTPANDGAEKAGA